MENRPNKPRRVIDPHREGAKEAGLTDQTPSFEERPTSSWAAMGSTRVLTPEEGVVARDLSRSDSTQSQVGEFKLLKKLGEGAMGAVFLARQPSFENRHVALKVLFPHVASNQKLVDRLEREAEAMFALDHPNIVKSFGVGEDDGWHYVAMEYVNGDSLQKWLNRVGRMSVADALNVTIACAQALEYAHSQGLIHRDIKPDNILITAKSEVKVADLGMVKKLDVDEEKGLTMTGHAVGTPWYMPLEQAKNAKDADGRCDIYALGCMFYCCLTGHPPFTGQTIVEVIQAKEKGTFPTARSFNSDVPERIDLIIAKMVQKLPKHRYQNCTELLRDLEGLQLASEGLAFLHQETQDDADPAARPSHSMVATIATESLVKQPVDTWFVKLRKDLEKPTKMTTAQIKDLLKRGQMEPLTLVSRNADEGFRSLTCYKEFESTASARLTRKGFGGNQRVMQMLSKKYDDVGRQREEDEAAKGDMISTKYWLRIFLQCLAVVVVVGGVGYGIFLLLQSVLSVF